MITGMADNTSIRTGLSFTDEDRKAIRLIRMKHNLIGVTEAVRRAIHYYANYLRGKK